MYYIHCTANQHRGMQKRKAIPRTKSRKSRVAESLSQMAHPYILQKRKRTNLPHVGLLKSTTRKLLSCVWRWNRWTCSAKILNDSKKDEMRFQKNRQQPWRTQRKNWKEDLERKTHCTKFDDSVGVSKPLQHFAHDEPWTLIIYFGAPLALCRQMPCGSSGSSFR